MSKLFVNPSVPNGKYRILPAANPALALKMQISDDFRIQAVAWDESEAQKWKIVAADDGAKDGTKYKIKNCLNCGVLNPNGDSNKPFLICSLRDYFWTIDPRGGSFIIGNDTNDEVGVALGHNNYPFLEQRKGRRPPRWILSPTAIFDPAQIYQITDGQNNLSMYSTTHANIRKIPRSDQRWNIIDAGRGYYHLKSAHCNLYIGWDAEIRDRRVALLSNLPHLWEITSLSNGLYQLWAVIDKSAPLGLGTLVGSSLEICSTPASWTVSVG